MKVLQLLLQKLSTTMIQYCRHEAEVQA